MTAGQVYFAECAGRIKIGHSRDVASRIRGLSTAAPAPISVLATVDGTVHFERALHKIVDAHRIRGEWFRDCEEVRALMATVVERGCAAIGFVEPTKRPREDRRFEFVMPPESPFKPIYRRISACMDRYIPDTLNDHLARENALGLPRGQLVNEIIDGHYTSERMAMAIMMLHHTLNSIEVLIDIVRSSSETGPRLDLEDVAGRASHYVSRLERCLPKLFESPDVGVTDLGGYEGLSPQEEVSPLS